MNLSAIREARAAKVAEMRTLLAAAEAQQRDLAEAERGRFDKLKAEVTGLDEQEARAQFLAEAERRALGTPADSEQRDRTRLEERCSLLRVLQAQIEQRALTGAEAEFAAEAERRSGRKAAGVFVPMALLEQRVEQRNQTTANAAALVGTDLREDQFIRPLRASLLARRLGVRTLSGLQGNVSIPRQTNAQATGWVAEGGAVPDGTLTFNSVTLTPRHAGGLTEMSRQLIMQSSPDIEQVVRDDLAFVLAQAIDSALIVGGGTNQPVGVLSTAGVQTAALATLNWAGILNMVRLAEQANAASASTCWLGSPEVKARLAGVLKAGTDAGAGYLLENGRMADLPAYFSTQVPRQAGTPDRLRLILGDWNQVLLGIWSELDVLANPFSDVAYARGGVRVRAMATVDVAVRHPVAFVVANDIALS
jgi:HK97 family phage major capsid protein